MQLENCEEPVRGSGLMPFFGDLITNIAMSAENSEILSFSSRPTYNNGHV
jgi:hypothetical protein